jgi:hypothetical protein
VALVDVSHPASPTVIDVQPVGIGPKGSSSSRAAIASSSPSPVRWQGPCRFSKSSTELRPSVRLRLHRRIEKGQRLVGLPQSRYMPASQLFTRFRIGWLSAGIVRRCLTSPACLARRSGSASSYRPSAATLAPSRLCV